VASLHGVKDGTEQHHVHHLSVIEPLEQERSEKAPIFLLLQRECHDASQQVNQHKSEEEDNRPLQVRLRPELGDARSVPV
jgi:hypothetical protein